MLSRRWNDPDASELRAVELRGGIHSLRQPGDANPALSAPQQSPEGEADSSTLGRSALGGGPRAKCMVQKVKNLMRIKPWYQLMRMLLMVLISKLLEMTR